MKIVRFGEDPFYYGREFSAEDVVRIVREDESSCQEHFLLCAHLFYHCRLSGIDVQAAETLAAKCLTRRRIEQLEQGYELCRPFAEIVEEKACDIARIEGTHVDAHALRLQQRIEAGVEAYLEQKANERRAARRERKTRDYLRARRQVLADLERIKPGRSRPPAERGAVRRAIAERMAAKPQGPCRKEKLPPVKKASRREMERAAFDILSKLDPNFFESIVEKAA